ARKIQARRFRPSLIISHLAVRAESATLHAPNHGRFLLQLQPRLPGLFFCRRRAPMPSWRKNYSRREYRFRLVLLFGCAAGIGNSTRAYHGRFLLNLAPLVGANFFAAVRWTPCGNVQCGGSRRLAPHPRLKTEHRRVGIGEITQARPIRSLEIFRHSGVEISSEQSGNRTVAIDEHQRAAAQREESSDRTGQADEALDRAAIDELGAAGQAFDLPPPEYERKVSLAGRAPQAHAAE